MSELTSDDDEETVNLASATNIFSSCALLFGLKRKGVILCGFNATCSLVNTELTPLVLVSLSGCPSCPFRWSMTLTDTSNNDIKLLILFRISAMALYILSICITVADVDKFNIRPRGCNIYASLTQRQCT